MFHFMFVHYTFSSVWVAEWPPFGKKLPARLAICSHCILSIFNIYLFPVFIPPQTVFVGGYSVFTLSVRPSDRPTVCP